MMTEGEWVSQWCVRETVTSHSGALRVWQGGIPWHKRQKQVLILDALPSFSCNPLFLLKPPLPSSPSYPPSPFFSLFYSSFTLLARHHCCSLLTSPHPFSPLLPVVCVCVGKIKLLWQSCVYKYAGRETGQATLNRNRIQIAFLSLLGPGREKMCLRLLLLRLWRIKPQYWAWAPC